MMGNEHRKRTKHFNLFLLDEEMEMLKSKAEEAKMSKSEFVRNVILFGAARGKTKYSSQDADKIIYELNRIGNNINQIAYQANVKCYVDKNEFLGLSDDYTQLLKLFEEYAIE